MKTVNIDGLFEKYDFENFNEIDGINFCRYFILNKIGCKLPYNTSSIETLTIIKNFASTNKENFNLEITIHFTETQYFAFRDILRAIGNLFSKKIYINHLFVRANTVEQVDKNYTPYLLGFEVNKILSDVVIFDKK